MARAMTIKIAMCGQGHSSPMQSQRWLEAQLYVISLSCPFMLEFPHNNLYNNFVCCEILKCHGPLILHEAHLFGVDLTQNPSHYIFHTM